MSREDLLHRSETLTTAPEVWDRLHKVAELTGSVVGPRRRPSWRRLLQRVGGMSDPDVGKLAKMLPPAK